MNHKPYILLLPILLLGAWFRFNGINWDSNWHLHPDERFLTMVATKLEWPASLASYLDTSTASTNPHNREFDFFVYGTYPVLLVKAVAEFIGPGDYNHLTLVGRALSGVFDLGTLVLIYLITLKLVSYPRPALLAALFYTLSVLPIQLSHFFAVDPYLVFFTTLSFYILVYLITQPAVILSIFLGLSFGLALAAKVSAAYFAPIIALGFMISYLVHRKFFRHILLLLLFTFSAYLTLRFSLPYLFASPEVFTVRPNPHLLANWQQLKSFEGPDVWFPPAIQWLTTPAYIFPAVNILWWGLGLPAAAIAAASLIHVLSRYRRHLVLLAVVWILGMFAYQGAQFVKALRYFYPLYPFLAITSGIFIHDLVKNYRRPLIVYILYALLILIWPLSFSSIYSRPHPRVVASNWLLTHLPPGATLSCDHWDDCLPLGSPGPFNLIEFPMFHPDTPHKWQDMVTRLASTDYLVISSNRVYGSVTSASHRYPVADRFYRLLFAGQLGFIKIAEFSSRPHLNLPISSACLTPPWSGYGRISSPLVDCTRPGLTIVDDFSDETFTVYDHPKVLIFQKIKPVDYSSFFATQKI